MVAVAARDKKRAEVYAKRHGIPIVHDSYDGKTILLHECTETPKEQYSSFEGFLLLFACVQETKHQALLTHHPSTHQRPLHRLHIQPAPQWPALRMDTQSPQSRQTRPPGEAICLQRRRSKIPLPSPNPPSTKCSSPSRSKPLSFPSCLAYPAIPFRSQRYRRGGRSSRDFCGFVFWG